MCDSGFFLFAASPVNSIWNEAAKLPFFLENRTGNSAFGLLQWIMCEQTEISPLFQTCVCLTEPLTAIEQNIPLVKAINGTPDRCKKQPGCEGGVLPLSAEQNCINHIMF